MEIIAAERASADFPVRLRTIPSPPDTLYMRSSALRTILERPAVAIVGSRNVTPYGRKVTYDFAYQLAEQGIVIISGLAMGVDAIAHRAALDAGGLTIAILPSSLDNVYPSSNRPLAERILANGGALISEYDSGPALKYRFVERNRLVAGLADVTLITEAAANSGSLYTAGYARDNNQIVMAVPGPIDARYSYGTNHLLRTGASLATELSDILDELGLDQHKTKISQARGSNPREQAIVDLLLQGVREGDKLLELSNLTVSQYNQSLTMLELHNKIRPLGANQWALT